MSRFRHLRVSPGELVCSAAVFAAGTFLVLYGRRYPLMTQDGVIGPGAMPVAAGLALAAVGIALVVRTLHQARSRPAEIPPPDHEGAAGEDDAVGKPLTVAGILCVLVATAVLAPYFGLIPVLSLAVFILVFVFERESALAAAALAAGGGIGSWLLFDRVLDVPFPTGSVWTALGI